jgi:hypothetical protein
MSKLTFTLLTFMFALSYLLIRELPMQLIIFLLLSQILYYEEVRLGEDMRYLLLVTFLPYKF